MYKCPKFDLQFNSFFQLIFYSLDYILAVTRDTSLLNLICKTGILGYWPLGPCSRSWLNRVVQYYVSQDSLGRLGLKFRTDYSLLGLTTKRGFRALHPAIDHCRAVSLISASMACAVFLSSLNTIAFLHLQRLHKVRIDMVCSFLPPELSSCWKQSTSSLVSSQDDKGHSKKRWCAVSRFLSHNAQK